jgi:hypothetical protein
VYECDYRRGFRLVTPFIDHLQIVTASNYSVIAKLHTSQNTREHARSSQSDFTSRFLVTDLNRGDSAASVLTSLPAGNLKTDLYMLQYNYSII